MLRARRDGYGSAGEMATKLVCFLSFDDGGALDCGVSERASFDFDFDFDFIFVFFFFLYFFLVFSLICYLDCSLAL